MNSFNSRDFLDFLSFSISKNLFSLLSWEKTKIPLPLYPIREPGFVLLLSFVEPISFGFLLCVYESSHARG
jgi:hypothetical protein